MASIKCACGHAIHYHGEPNGTEYIWFSMEDWKRITSSVFSKQRDERVERSDYPRLYRTDTISEDFPEAINKVWRCPNCGRIMMFDKAHNLNKVFEHDNMIAGENQIESSDSLKGVLYDDYTWDHLTELGIPDREIEARISPILYTLLSGDILQIVPVNEKESMQFKEAGYYRMCIPVENAE